jgi:bacteriocin biosynthesis cyclodehydratase domain-containing protein
MTGARGPLHIVGAGPWGHEVAERLAARATTPATVSLIGLDATPSDLTFPPSAQARVLAAGRAVPGLAAAFDHSAYASSTPWLAVVMAHPYLQIGPAVAPGRGACNGCWQRRLRQHAPAPELDAALQRHYEEHPAQEPTGQVAPSAALAAAMASRIVDRLVSDPDIDGGWLRQVNLVSRQMAKGRAIGIHGCERCGLGRREADRSHERLSVAMSHSLGWET